MKPLSKHIFLILILLVSMFGTAGAQSSLKSMKDKSSQHWGFVNTGKHSNWWALALKGGDDVNMHGGYADDWQVAPMYDEVSKSFSEDLAAVRIGNRVGFVDSHNRMVIPPRFLPGKDIKGFKFGMSAVNINGKYGFVDKNGRVVIPPKFDYADNFDDDYMAVVVMNKKYGAIDMTGDTVVPCKYLNVPMMCTVPISNKAYREAARKVKDNYQAGKYRAFLDKIYQVADGVGKCIADTTYDFRLSVKNPQIDKKGELYGLHIFNDTAWVLRPQYDNITVGRDGYYRVTKKGKTGIADAYGRLIVPCEYDDVQYQSNDGLFVVKRGSEEAALVGLIDKNGYMVIPPFYDAIDGFRGGKARAWILDAPVIIDRQGVMQSGDANVLMRKACKKEKLSERLVDLIRVARLRPDMAQAHHLIGLCELDMTSYGDGINRLKLAHKLSPSDKDIETDLKEAKHERSERRWNRVLSVLSAASAVVTTAASVYSVTHGGEAIAADNTSGTSYDDGTVGTTTGVGGGTSAAGGSAKALDPATKEMHRQSYQQIYNQWANHAESSYNSLMHVGSASEYSRDKGLFRQAKKEMVNERQKAAREGIILQRSQWEDADVKPYNGNDSSGNGVTFGREGVRPKK
jgi:hypothetical protein